MRCIPCRSVVLACALAFACSAGPKPGPVTGTADQPPPRPVVSAKPGPFAAAEKLFGQKCAGCHQGARRNAPRLGPGYNSRIWIKGFLLNPSGDEYFGRTKIRKMKRVSLRGTDLDAVVELIYSQTGAADANAALARKGRQLFDGGTCTKCHALDFATVDKIGPNLGKRGSVDTLAMFLADPGHDRWFGNLNEMPRFGDKLSVAQRRALAQYILSWQQKR